MSMKSKKIFNAFIWLFTIAVFVFFIATSCDLQETPNVNGTTAAFKAALPDVDKIQMSIPSSPSAYLKSELGEQGQIATFYQTSTLLSTNINANIYFVLYVIDEIINSDGLLTIATEEEHVWGPFTSEENGRTYKLRMLKLGDEYSITFSIKSDLVSDFVTLMDGTVSESLETTAAGYNQGSFTIYFANQGLVRGDSTLQGTLDVQYDVRNWPDQIYIDCVATDMITEDDALSGTPMNASYDYDEDQTVEASAEVIAFNFSIYMNLIEDTSDLEYVTLDAKWTHEAEGKGGVADVSLSGGDAGTEGYGISECWNSRTLSIYFSNTADPSASYGDSSECAFTPEY